MAEIIKKSYQLTLYRNYLSAQEQDLLSLVIRSLKKEASKEVFSDSQGMFDEDALPNSFVWNRDELSKTLKISPQTISKSLNEAVGNMVGKKIQFQKDTSGSWELAALFTYANYDKGVLRIDIHDRTKKAILDETRGVSFVDLDLFMTLTGGYEKRILDLISKFKNQRNFEMGFDDFQLTMGKNINDFPRKISGFRTAVLDKPMKRLFAASNGVWEPKDEKGKGYELIKVGRVVKKIVFLVGYNDPESSKNNVIAEQKERARIASITSLDIAELQEMEAAIMEMNKIDTFARISISGYQATANDYGYQIPDKVVAKIKSLRGK